MSEQQAFSYESETAPRVESISLNLSHSEDLLKKLGILDTTSSLSAHKISDLNTNRLAKVITVRPDSEDPSVLSGIDINLEQIAKILAQQLPVHNRVTEALLPSRKRQRELLRDMFLDAIIQEIRQVSGLKYIISMLKRAADKTELDQRQLAQLNVFLASFPKEYAQSKKTLQIIKHLLRALPETKSPNKQMTELIELKGVFEQILLDGVDLLNDVDTISKLQQHLTVLPPFFQQTPSNQRLVS